LPNAANRFPQCFDAAGACLKWRALSFPPSGQRRLIAICLLLQNCRIQLKKWFVFLESVRGVRPAAGLWSHYCGIDARVSWQTRAPFSNKAIQDASSSPASARSAEPICATSRRSWPIRISQRPRFTQIDSRPHSRGKPSAALVGSFSVPSARFDQKGKRRLPTRRSFNSSSRGCSVSRIRRLSVNFG
jgi:hypothetical protein